ncbi:MAG: uncharacterized LabA/DUF88 family protein [Candidatus Paceibacteria bacterium]|jgi:uncharacterized LabA/DUF88 family protein
MYKKDNNYAFIDSQNVYRSIKSLGWKIDWMKFRIYLKEHYSVTNAYLFIGYIEENEKLYTKLRKAGFVCIFKPVTRDHRGNIKGNVDTELAMHTMIQLDNFDKAIIVAGDGDYYCLVDYLHKLDKLKMVLIPNSRKYSSLLKKFAKKNISFIDRMRKTLEVKK